MITLCHPPDDVDVGSIYRVTRDPDTPPLGYRYLTFNGMPLTFRGRKLMFRITDEQPSN